MYPSGAVRRAVGIRLGQGESLESIVSSSHQVGPAQQLPNTGCRSMLESYEGTVCWAANRPAWPGYGPVILQAQRQSTGSTRASQPPESASSLRPIMP